MYSVKPQDSLKAEDKLGQYLFLTILLVVAIAAMALLWYRCEHITEVIHVFQ